MINIHQDTKILITPINIQRGTKEDLEIFLNKMVTYGFFESSYNEAASHFSFNYDLLVDDIAISPINFNVNSMSEIFRFCYFLRDSYLISQPLYDLWTNFSYKNEWMKKDKYSLAYNSKKYYPGVPYMHVYNTRLRSLLKSYYEKTK
ncbi:MAG: hypothetical protein FWD13_10540 [Treponema sp.]|nr:hypothetical protein [Treponema sp.]